jgi:tetratricopeptide (TPR) repeat protein
VVLNELAPTDQVGYPPAQLWRAKRLLAEARSSPKGLATAERLLGFVLQSAPENIEANALLGELYFKTRRTAQADPHLQRAASDHPELLFLLAKIYDEQGRQSEARRQAELARSIFRKKAETNPDDREARGYWAAAMLVLEDFPAAVDILQQGLARGDDPFYHQALARVYVAHSDALGRDSEASLGDRLALLEEALTHNPSDPNLLDRLVTIIRMGGEEADRVVSRLRGLLAAGKATALVHFALGIAAWERGETEQSRLHFEQASRDAPQMALVANNLAWVLANTEPHDLPRALELANRAIGRWPDQPKCRGTRGHILVKMRKWKDALPDLEAALRARPDDLDLHRLLAETYENLGVTEMASEHRRRTVARDGAESGR